MESFNVMKRSAVKALTREFALPPGFRVLPVLRQLAQGPGDPTTVIRADIGTWLALPTPDGSVTVRVLSPDAGRVILGAWGPGAPWVIESGADLLGLTDDWSAFDAPAFQARLPERLQALRRLHPHLAAPATHRVWPMLLASILGQKITYSEAQFAWRLLTERFGEPAPGSSTGVAPPWLRVAPTQQAVRRVSSWDWHAAKVDHSRSTTALLASRSPSLEKIAGLSEADAYAALQRLPGIGPWTAAETIQRSHAAQDAVAVGDFHLAHFVGQALVGRRVDDEGMLTLLAPYAGQRQRVVRLLMTSGMRKQAYGPRLAPEDHRQR
jgi:3-methyladenine DNA glycosylase/8-oxoguanine DNA glycosylase